MGKRKTVQWVTLLVSLVALLFLMRNKKEPLAITAMLTLSVGAIFYGKLFCGYLCPFHAYDKLLSTLLGRLGIKRLDPGRLEKVRYVLYVISFAILALVVMKALAPYTKIRVQVPILMVAIVFLTFFTPRLWHRYLCPFAMIMRLPSITRPLKPSITASRCKRCKACQKACPTDAITIDEETLDISGTHCILCYQCEDACKYDSIEV